MTHMSLHLMMQCKGRCFQAVQRRTGLEYIRQLCGGEEVGKDGTNFQVEESLIHANVTGVLLL